MFAKICILIENTPRSMTMPYGTGTFAVCARNRFLTYDRLKYYCKRGAATFTHHTLASFLRNWNLCVTL